MAIRDQFSKGISRGNCQRKQIFVPTSPLFPMVRMSEPRTNGVLRVVSAGTVTESEFCDAVTGLPWEEIGKVTVQSFKDMHAKFRAIYLGLTTAERNAFGERLRSIATPAGRMSAAAVEHYLGWLFPDFVSVPAMDIPGADVIAEAIQLLGKCREIAMDECHRSNWALPADPFQRIDAMCVIAWLDAAEAAQHTSFLVPFLLSECTVYSHAAGLAWRLHEEANSPVLSEALNAMRALPAGDVYEGASTLGALLARVGDAELLAQYSAFFLDSPDPELRELGESIR